MKIEIRTCRLPDDLIPLTALLHRAYAELAARGLKYVATYQTVDVTERRVRAGHCFIAEAEGAIVGTLTVRHPNPAATVSTYREPATFTFGQFGVDPTMRGKGIGSSLHENALHFARENGGTAMALDTAAPAEHLIALYSKWGYREVSRHQWDVTNYESVIMKKEFEQRPVVPPQTTSAAEKVGR
jgi:GNAT superfamily N-acetyltransferase